MENIEIVKNFKIHNKPYCVLGVLKTVNGLHIEQEMIKNLSVKYDIISVRQEPPDNQFEYPAIKYTLDLAKENKCDILYLHTKGAANNYETQTYIRQMWFDEFINHFDDYQNILNMNKEQPVIITPFTGKQKVTWFNAFYINYQLACAYNLPFYTDRYKYEMLFCDTNYNIIGRIMNNVDNGIHPDGTINFDTESKRKMFNYINNNFKEKKIETFPYYYI